MKKLRHRFRSIVLLILLAAVLSMLVVLWPGLRKADLRYPFSRQGWELPDLVVESLKIQPGAQVADIGAGGGYFTFRLARAVGPAGTVYAVDVEPGVIDSLKESVQAKGVKNVQVVFGEYQDPLLPDGKIDLAFVCNT